MDWISFIEIILFTIILIFEFINYILIYTHELYTHEKIRIIDFI